MNIYIGFDIVLSIFMTHYTYFHITPVMSTP